MADALLARHIAAVGRHTCEAIATTMKIASRAAPASGAPAEGLERSRGGRRLDRTHCDRSGRSFLDGAAAPGGIGQALGPSGLAIRGYAPVPPGAPYYQRIVMADRDWPAYAWSFPIGDGRRNVGYGELLRSSSIRRTHLLDRLGMLLPDTDRGTITDLKAHHLPLSSRRPIAGRGRRLLAGDALSLINPFTDEGIFYAVVSGALAGQTAATGAANAGERYAEALRSRLGRHLRHTTALRRITTKQWIVDAGVPLISATSQLSTRPRRPKDQDA